MHKLIKKAKQILNYKDIISSTKVTYWPHFIQHTYGKKKNKIEEYKKTPENLVFRYLPVEEHNLMSCLIPCTDQILIGAEDICIGKTHVFELVTKKIENQWNSDPLTGYNWPMVFYADVRKIAPQGIIDNNNDIKYPWELSNSHHLVILAEAYFLTKSPKYREEYLRLIQNWVDNNPIGMGVNWCCTMDVSLRAINIIVSASIMMAADSSFEKDFLKYNRLLYSHMLFIRDNLEYGFVRENHYLSDITGLKLLAQCFAEDKIANEILKFSRHSFREEICYQIYEDGADHEASTCYHCFVLELFAIGLATDETLRKELSKKEWQRIDRMIAFSEMLCEFSVYPIIGDNDSGRVLDLNGTGEYRKDILSFSQHVLGINAGKPCVYDFLLQGNVVSRPEHEHQGCGITIYKDSGYGVLNNEKIRLLVHSGNIGRKGKGGHGHNDITSFVMDVKGMPFIIDPGTGVYERDLRIRHWFRSTAAHNCVYFEGIEQNRISVNSPFKMDHYTKATIKEQNDKIVCVHEGYVERLGIQSRREIRWNAGTLYVDDYLIKNSNYCFGCCYTFAEGVSLEKRGMDVIAHLKNETSVTITFSEVCESKILEVDFSPDYGVIKKTCGLLITCTQPCDHICVAYHINGYEG